jgi:hypothetical protein
MYDLLAGYASSNRNNHSLFVENFRLDVRFAASLPKEESFRGADDAHFTFFYKEVVNGHQTIAPISFELL